MREGNSDEDDGVFLDNNSNGDIKYEYSGQSPVGGYIGVGEWVGGSGEEIRFWV